MLTFSVNKQIIKRTDDLRPVGNSQEYLYANFIFEDNEWESLNKTAMFKAGTKPYAVLLDEENKCLVPAEAIAFVSSTGQKVKVSIVGSKDNVEVPTNEVEVFFEPSGYLKGKIPADPTPNIFEQYIHQVKEYIEISKQIKELSNANLWELETGIYYLNGGFNYTNSDGVGGDGHIVIIYKPQPNQKAVRYIHFCGGTSLSSWSSVKCGYTDGTTNKEYAILDTSKIADSVSKSNYNIPTAKAVYDYVNEVIGSIENGSY